MATHKPISTISYNTPNFLLEKLDTWYSNHTIQAYQVIFHKGEDGDKDHAHVRIEPNKRVDPMDLQNDLKEYVSNNVKPLGVRPWRPSKEEDWILYAVHEPHYMKIKYPNDPHEKIPYKWQDIKAPEDYDVECAYVRAMSTLDHLGANLVDQIRQGKSGIELVQTGENPFLVNQLVRMVAGTDFERLQKEYQTLKTRFRTLVLAIRQEGFDINEDSQGRYKLVKQDKFSSVPEQITIMDLDFDNLHDVQDSDLKKLSLQGDDCVSNRQTEIVAQPRKERSDQ